MLDSFLAKVQSREARVAIMGLGYVGLPLASLFVGAGFRVTGFDVNQPYVDDLMAGISAVLDVPNAELQGLLDSGRFRATSDVREMGSADVYVICVPTPLNKTRQPDMSYISSALQLLVSIWESGKLVVLESTTYPGTTEEILLPALTRPDCHLDRDFLLAFSPERVDPGNRTIALREITKVVGGVSQDSSVGATALYQTIFEKIHVVSKARTAEICKLLENTFRNVNIALVNEFAQICQNLDVDVWEAIEAARTKPFGFMAFYPGPGIGGHCIPLDPQYLVYKARLHGYEPRLVALADQINQEMPQHVVYKAMERLNQHSQALRGAKVLVLGVAYKPDIPDARESPAYDVIEGLMHLGALVSYSDPYVPTFSLEHGPTTLLAVACTPQVLREQDLIIIITAHKAFDCTLLDGMHDRVLDTRNALGDASSRGL